MGNRAPAAAVLRMVRTLAIERSRALPLRAAALVSLAAGAGAARGWVGLTVGGAAPELTPSAVGTYAALLASTLLSLAGFFVVRGGIQRDRESGVMELLATTPTSAWRYLLVQFLANLSLLAGLLGALALGAVAALERPLAAGWAQSALDVLLPVAVLGGTCVAFVAGAAVAFDAFAATSGAIGNAIFFALWVAFLSSSFGASGGDFMGIGFVVASLKQATRELSPPVSGNVALFVDVPTAHRTYPWAGPTWTAAFLRQRILWCALGVVAAFLPAALANPLERRGAKDRANRPAPADGGASARPSPWARPRLGALGGRWPRFAVELRLLLADLRWWHVGALAASVGIGLGQDSATGLHRVLPFAWLWPVGLLAAVGGREFDGDVGQLLITKERIVVHRLLASWWLGVLALLACGGGVLARAFLSGAVAAALGVVAGAMFVSALCLFLATMARSRRLFEAAYLLFWYLGPIRGNWALDFSGAWSPRGDLAQTAMFASVAAALIGAVVARRTIGARV